MKKIIPQVFRKRKAGSSLVEVIVGTMILALIVVTVVTGLAFSRNTIVRSSSSDQYASEAKWAADALIVFLNSEESIDPDFLRTKGDTYAALLNAHSVYSFDEPLPCFYVSSGNDFTKDITDEFTLNNLQFQISPALKEDGTPIPDFYQLTLRRYFGGSENRNYAQQIVYAHKGW